MLRPDLAAFLRLALNSRGAVVPLVVAQVLERVGTESTA
jgi:hypothetical protein